MNALLAVLAGLGSVAVTLLFAWCLWRIDRWLTRRKWMRFVQGPARRF